MPVNLSTSGNLDISGIFEGEDGEPRGNIVGTDDGRVAPKSLSAEDLQEVANLFEIRKKKRSWENMNTSDTPQSFVWLYAPVDDMYAPLNLIRRLSTMKAVFTPL